MVDTAIAHMNDVRARPDDHGERERSRRPATGVKTECLDEMIVCPVCGGAEVLGEVLPMIGGIAVVCTDHFTQVFDDGRNDDGGPDNRSKTWVFSRFVCLTCTARCSATVTKWSSFTARTFPACDIP